MVKPPKPPKKSSPTSKTAKKTAAKKKEYIPTKKERELAELKRLLSDRSYRLSNLYYIIDAKGDRVRFKPNWAQVQLYNNRHCFNVILKARQLGMSTFLQIYALDQCLFVANYSAGIIAHTVKDAEDLFSNKVKFAYDNLPEWLKMVRPIVQDSARSLKIDHGDGASSKITVGTSLRGGTHQLLHVSEYGKIAASNPEKAREIKTGALNTVHSGQEIYIESTAEGNTGAFFDLCKRASDLIKEGAELTPLDPKLHFFPWYANPDNSLKDVDVSISREMAAYFDALPVELTPEQKSWYIKKSEQQGDDMKREFPSTPREAFEQSMEGAIYGKEMGEVRKRGGISNYPHDRAHRVYTFWDLGKGSDYTSIWFVQYIDKQYRFIDYHESHNEGWDFYARLLTDKMYLYGGHVLPWDGEMKVAGVEMTNVKMMLLGLGVLPIKCVKKTGSVWNDIKTFCKPELVNCKFDMDACADGIAHLDNVRWEWDNRLAQWKKIMLHDDCSHAADAFRTFAVGKSLFDMTGLDSIYNSYGGTEIAEVDEYVL